MSMNHDLHDNVCIPLIWVSHFCQILFIFCFFIPFFFFNFSSLLFFFPATILYNIYYFYWVHIPILAWDKTRYMGDPAGYSVVGMHLYSVQSSYI